MHRELTWERLTAVTREPGGCEPHRARFQRGSWARCCRGGEEARLTATGVSTVHCHLGGGNRGFPSHLALVGQLGEPGSNKEIHVSPWVLWPPHLGRMCLQWGDMNLCLPVGSLAALLMWDGWGSLNHTNILLQFPHISPVSFHWKGGPQSPLFHSFYHNKNCIMLKCHIWMVHVSPKASLEAYYIGIFSSRQ